ncbi:uncharacterized protein LOC120650926 isoform X3 [Panicum virgatum]|uniref:uncharacterized protein LOC120650926 isoform X3 n=1 Tax=Panicum virgatum TaxID=38727 RepID=UPI0019D685DF|nr:uncharacterized protein LOC120650926 isoform X3 [Panicum virgatum]
MVYNCPHLYAPEDETGSTSGGGSTLDRFLASCARWGLRRPPSSSGSLAKLGCSRALQWCWWSCRICRSRVLFLRSTALRFCHGKANMICLQLYYCIRV